MIKWCTLQLNLMPLIAVETDSAIQKLNDLLQKVNAYGHSEDIDLLNELRKSIERRIESMDRFYEQKHSYETIDIFHMLKLKLQKAIFKIGHISNDTISSEMISNMFEHDSKTMRRSAQKSRNESSTFQKHSHKDPIFDDSSESNLIYEESRNDLQWMEPGNSSFDFGQDRLFPEKIKQNSASKSPQKKNEKFQKKEQSKSPLKKNQTTANFRNNKKQELQRNEKNELKKVHTLKSQIQASSTHRPKDLNQNHAPLAKKNEKSGLHSSKEKFDKLGAKMNLNSSKQKKFPQKMQKNRGSQIIQQQKKKETKKNEKVLLGNNHKLNSPKNSHRRDSNNILIQEEMQQGVSENEFRFTIKMTREEYENLQRMKKEMMKK